MPFNLKQSAIEVRQLLSEQSPALAGLPLPRLQAMIPIALEPYARSLDARRRAQLRRKITFLLSSGSFNLTPLIDGTTSRIDLADIPKTTLYRASDNRAFTWVGSREQLNYGRLGEYDSPAAFLDGYFLYTRSHTGAPLSENVYLTVFVFPATVSDVPTTLQKDFIAFAANFVRQSLITEGA